MSKIGNPIFDNTIKMLRHASKSSGAKIWLTASKCLSKSISRKSKVNVGKISYITKEDEVVFIPGKVLGGGAVSHRIVVGAYTFTKSASDKIKNAGGEILPIPVFLERYPTGKDVKIIGG
jgi:large subunit ribosomal protein L18e|tara:strand:- start:169 stop:528 length:360 start_codon:yes stop_codon:yes gene_type:complete